MSDSTLENLYAVVESTYGTTPASDPTFSRIRKTSCGITTQKGTNVSQETHAHRGITDFRHGAKSVQGPFGIELSYTSFDTYLEALLGGTWAAKATITGTTISAAASDNSFNDSGNGFVTAGFEVGDVITVSGFTGDTDNNSTFTITAVTAGKITIGGTDGDVIVDDAAGESVTIAASDIVKQGTTRRSYSLLRHFTDQSVKPYHLFAGCEFNSLSLTIPADGMTTGEFAALGKSHSVLANLSTLGTPTLGSAGTTPPFDAYTGTITEGGSSIGVATEVSLSIENGLAARYAIGSDSTLQPSIGQIAVTGTLTAFFETTDLLEKFLNETESSLVVTLQDLDGNRLKIDLPRIKYNGGPLDTTNQGPITVALPFQALYDSTDVTSIAFTRIPVAA